MLGTRPEIIKLAHIIRILGPAVSVVHTGQHYDASLSALFIEAFGLDEPEVHLDVGGKTRGSQIGSAVSALDVHLERNRPRALVVQGDTNTALAGAIAGNAREVPVLHVEAGLRSYDRRMPEEHNRVLIDHMGDLLFAPTQIAEKNLLEEGIPDSRIRVTGNTVVEAVLELLPAIDQRMVLLDRYGLKPAGYILSTFHRPENVDDPTRFGVVLEQLVSLELPVVLPLHPRSMARAREHGMTGLLEGIHVVDPIGYRDFLALSAESAFLISDSGGVQEEVSVFKRSVIVVRRSTERPEVLGTFAELVEPGPEISAVAGRWGDDVTGLHERLAEYPSPYGDGTASDQIVGEIGALIGGS
ncbi:MAG: non-hydrolyzing UDP-N-acetylglucosamine 2-epimerase [Acidimicrobiia bacterium]